MVWLPDGEIILKISLFILTECTNVTDTHTPHDSIGRACIASRGKKELTGRITRHTHEQIRSLLISEVTAVQDKSVRWYNLQYYAM